MWSPARGLDWNLGATCLRPPKKDFWRLPAHTASADYSAVLARFRACVLAFHLVRRIAAFTLSLVARLNLPVPLATFETVAVETPAAAATSFIVTGPGFGMIALFAVNREALHCSRMTRTAVHSYAANNPSSGYPRSIFKRRNRSNAWTILCVLSGYERPEFPGGRRGGLGSKTMAADETGILTSCIGTEQHFDVDIDNMNPSAGGLSAGTFFRPVSR